MRKNWCYKGKLYDENFCEIASMAHNAKNNSPNISFFPRAFNVIYRVFRKNFPNNTTYIILESNALPSIHFECEKQIDDTQEIIALARQKAREQGIISNKINYEIALCINKHFYDENLQEVRVYFIDEKKILSALNCVEGHKVIMGIDSFMLAKEIQDGFLYVSDYEEIIFVKEGRVCGTLSACPQDLEQKVAILRDMYGYRNLHNICLRDEVAILLEISLKQIKQIAILDVYKEQIANEWENHKNALLQNKTFFLPNHLSFFTRGKSHILRNTIIALSVVVCLVYPSVMFMQGLVLHSRLIALQGKDFDFANLESSATTKDNEIQALQETNASLYKKLEHLAQNISTPISARINEIFSLLQTFDIALEYMVLAKGEEMNAINLHIHALNQAQIMHFLKALNNRKSEARVKQILHKDEMAHSQVSIVYYE